MKHIVLDLMRRHRWWLLLAALLCGFLQFHNIPLGYVFTIMGGALVWFDLQAGVPKTYASLPVARGRATAALWLCAVVVCPMAYACIALIMAAGGWLAGHDTAMVLIRLPLVVLWCMGWAACYFLVMKMAPGGQGPREQIFNGLGTIALMSPLLVMAFLMSEAVDFTARRSTGLPDLLPLLPPYAVPALSSASAFLIVLSYVLRQRVLAPNSARTKGRPAPSCVQPAVVSPLTAFLRPWRDCAVAAFSYTATAAVMLVAGRFFFQHLFSRIPGAEIGQDLAALTGALGGVMVPLLILVIWQPRALSLRVLRALPMSRPRLTAYILSFPVIAASLWLVCWTPVVLVFAWGSLLVMLSYAGLGGSLTLLALPLFMHIRHHAAFAFGWFGLVASAAVLVGLTSPLVAAILAVPLGILGVALIHYLIGTCGGYRPMFTGTRNMWGF